MAWRKPRGRVGRQGHPSRRRGLRLACPTGLGPLTEAPLTEAHLIEAHLTEAWLTEAVLTVAPRAALGAS